MKHILSLSHPQAMDIRREDGGRSHGADQDWYSLPWRQRAGCGPTTASVQMAYLAAQRPSLAALCPLEGREQGTFVGYMDQVWEYVTPGDHGLNRVEMYTGGVARFCEARGVKLVPRALEVPAGEGRPGFDRCAAFIRAGLASTAPWPSSTWTMGRWRPWTSGTGCFSLPWRRGTGELWPLWWTAAGYSPLI